MRRDVQNTDSNQLYTRAFKVDLNTFIAALNKQVGQTVTNLSQQLSVLRRILSDAGADMQPPKALFFNERQGTLVVRASLTDLDIVEQFVATLNTATPQLNIKAKFVEMSEDVARELYLNGTWFSLDDVGSTRNRILTDARCRKVLETLENQEGVDVLAMPSVTTLSGHQAQIQMVDVKTIMAIINPSNSAVPVGITDLAYKIKDVPLGPTLDVLPTVSSDGYSIQLTLDRTVTEFLGYDKVPPELIGREENAFTEGDAAPGELLPHFRVRHATTSCVVWDGQTAILDLPSDQSITAKAGSKEFKPSNGSHEMHLYVFVTPTIIDPVGNRVHTDEEMRKFDKKVPRQRR